MSSSDTSRAKHTRHEHSLPDHLPSCPHCGNLCGRLARLCADCGAYLYEPDLDDRVNREKLHGRSLHDGRDIDGRYTPRPEREDTQPTKGKVI